MLLYGFRMHIVRYSKIVHLGLEIIQYFVMILGVFYGRKGRVSCEWNGKSPLVRRSKEVVPKMDKIFKYFYLNIHQKTIFVESESYYKNFK